MWFAVERFGAILDLRTGHRWPSAMLASAVRHRAAILRARGVTRGDRVLLCQSGCGSFFADLFAVWQVGGCAVCVSPTITPSEIENLVGFLEPVLLLVGADADAAPTASIPCLRLSDRPIDRDTHDGERYVSALDDDALMLLTSGTTGQPKCVVHSFRSLLARVALNCQIVGEEALQRTLCVLPMYFGHGLIGNALTPLISGHDLAIASDAGVGLFERLDRLIDEHAITFMSSVPTTWRLTLQFCRRTPSPTLRRVHVGSAPLSASLWRSIIEWSGTRDVVNAYGLTETANWAAGASALTCEPRDGLVGRVWGGRAAIIRADGEWASAGEGEIALQTPSLMRGYYRRPDLDALTWRDGWFRTRDMGQLDPDGTIRLLGRLGQEINRGGIKVQPQDIEQLLEQHDYVVEACAFGVKDAILGQTVGVALILADEAKTELAAVKAWSASRLSPEKFPDLWFVTASIPKTERGKVDRLAVAKYCLSLEGRSHGLTPPTILPPDRPTKNVRR